MGGKSGKKVTIGFKYYMGQHMGLVHGPVDFLSRIRVGEKDAWFGVSEGGRVNIQQPNLFGGEAGEGGIEGPLDFEQGLPDQQENAYLKARFGGLIPAFRGVTCAVLNQVYLAAFNPYLKPWAFTLTRTDVTTRGEEQWYVDRARIGDEGGFGPIGTIQFEGTVCYGELTPSGGYFQTCEFVSHSISDDIYSGTVKFRDYDTSGALLDERTLTHTMSASGLNKSLTWWRTQFIYGKPNTFALWYVISEGGGPFVSVYPNGTRILIPNEFVGSVKGGANSRPECYASGNYWFAMQNHLVRVNETLTSFAAFTLHNPVSPPDYSNHQGAWVTHDPVANRFFVSMFDTGQTDDAVYIEFDGLNPEFPFWTHIEPSSSMNNKRTPISVYAGCFMSLVRNTQSDGTRFRVTQFRVEPDGLTKVQDWTGAVLDSGALNSGMKSLGDGFHINGNRLYTCGDIDCLDMNPAHIIRECLTDKEWGMGYADSDIDDSSFTAAADTLFFEARGISLLWQRETTIESFIQEVVRHADAALYVSRTTGQFVLKLIRDDFDPESLITLSPNNVERVENFRRPAFGDLVNTVTAVYQACPDDRQASVSVQDIALVQMQGGVVGATIEYPGFSNRRNAAWAAQRDLQSMSVPLVSCTIYTGPDAELLDIGDTFRFEWPDYFDGAKIMRVVGMAFGDGRTQRIRIECVEDAFSAPQEGLLSNESETLWENPSIAPDPAEHQLTVEAPYRDLVGEIGETAAKQLLEDNPDVGFIATTAARPQEGGNAISAQINVDSGAGFEASVNADFSPFAVLSEDIGYTDTTLPITDAQDFDDLQVGTWAQIGDELVRLDSINEVDGEIVSVTVGRGVLDTVPTEHPEGENIFFWEEFAGSDEIEYVAAEEISVKLLPRNNSGIVTLGQAVAMPLTFGSRAIRPYPPGALFINGQAYPETIPAEDLLSLTWAHRDRLQQTAGTIISTEEPSIGPETGTTYTVTIRDINLVLLQEETGITGTSWTESAESPITEAEFFVELKSVRDGFDSFQAHRVFVVRDPLEAPTNLTAVFLEGD